jgi:hypothetical protein
VAVMAVDVADCAVATFGERHDAPSHRLVGGGPSQLPQPQPRVRRRCVADAERLSEVVSHLQFRAPAMPITPSEISSSWLGPSQDPTAFQPPTITPASNRRPDAAGSLTNLADRASYVRILLILMRTACNFCYLPYWRREMSILRRSGEIILASGLLIAAGLASASAVAPTHSATEGATSKGIRGSLASPAGSQDVNWALQATLVQMALKADAVGAKDPTYAGSSVDTASGTMWVYQRPTAGLIANVSAYTYLALPGTKVGIRQALLTQAQSADLSSLIAAAEPTFAAAGDRLLDGEFPT